MSTTEPETPSIDADKRMQVCRQVWRTDYARILSHARATQELGAYERCHSAINVNKGISFGLVPLTALGAYGHIWKTKPSDIGKHQKAVGGVIALAVLTNMWAAYSNGQIPVMEDRLVEKYVWPLPDSTLTNYAKGNRRFPNAK